MKKELWIKANQNTDWEKRKKLVTTALESGADAVLVRTGESGKVKELGRITTISDDKDSDVQLIPDDIKKLKRLKKPQAFYKIIKSKDDEREIAKAGKIADFVVINAQDWKVIPLENLIAELKGKCKLLVEVANAAEAKLALQTLEVGADGLLINADVNEIIKIRKTIEEMTTKKLELQVAKITEIKPVGMGDRVCVDTASMFRLGEGMLIGSQSNALFLVHSETVETPYVAPRPFRVNAGPVHAYTLLPNGKTNYLSELATGDEVLAVDWKGNTRTLILGRSKIEKRPLLMIEAKFKNKKFRTLLQNAETIRLVNPKGKPVSVAKVKVGDEVLVYLEDVGRHFGMAVKESIKEK